MKKFTFLLLLFSMALSLFAQGFIHPGALHTEEDFVRIRAQLDEGHPRVTAGWENLKANEWSQSNVGSWPTEIIKRGIAGDENYMNAARGAAAAYQNALRWRISGEEAHAQRAVEIMNAWAATTVDIHGNTNMSLAAGLYGYAFANAGELMRDYEGWDAADFAKYQDWMMYVFYPKAIGFLRLRHDTWQRGWPGHYWANWGLCNALAVISIGVLCDDVYVYNEGVSYYKYDLVGTYSDDRTAPILNDGLNEFLGNAFPIVYPDERGPYGFLAQAQESGRDQGHTVMMTGLAIDIAQVGWNQGDDLFAHMDHRLAAGVEYVAAYNSWVDDVPFTEYRYSSVGSAPHLAWVQSAPNEHARGQFRPYWDRVVGHYEGIKGVEMPYARQMSESVPADAGGSGGTSGGYDHLGYSTLTSTRPKVGPEQAPVSMKTLMFYDGIEYKRGELSNVEPGSTVRLIPVLPDEETDTGNWEWESGETTRELEVVADESKLYRVYYVNERGVRSTQLFSIHVRGEGQEDRFTPVVRFNGKTIHEFVVEVPQYTEVSLEAWSRMGYGTWRWENGSTSPVLTVDIKDVDLQVTLTHITPAGVETQMEFNLEVEPLMAAFKVDEGDLQAGSLIAITAGQKVTLMPGLKDGAEGGSWLWSDGSTEPQLVFDEVNEHTEISVTYTLDETDYEQVFNIQVLPFESAWAYFPMEELSAEVKDAWSAWNGYMFTGRRENSVLGKGIALTGNSGSYLSFPEGMFRNHKDFCVAVWVRPDALVRWARIWDFGSGPDYNMFLTPSGSNENLQFSIKAGTVTQDITTSVLLEEGAWAHVAVVKNGNVGQLYVNGALVGTNSSMTLSPSSLGNTTQNWVGRSQYSADPSFAGMVDDLRIYRSALTPAEVVELAEMPVPAVPQNVLALNEGDNIRLNWDPVPGVTSYTVLRAESPDGPFEPARINLSSATFSDRGSRLDLGKTYHYSVRAENFNLIGGNSEIVSAVAGATSLTNLQVNDWSLWPNPVKDHVILSFHGQRGEQWLVRVLDLHGREMKRSVVSLDEDLRLDLSSLAAGFYLVELMDVAGEVRKVERFTKL